MLTRLHMQNVDAIACRQGLDLVMLVSHLHNVPVPRFLFEAVREDRCSGKGRAYAQAALEVSWFRFGPDGFVDLTHRDIMPGDGVLDLAVLMDSLARRRTPGADLAQDIGRVVADTELFQRVFPEALRDGWECARLTDCLASLIDGDVSLAIRQLQKATFPPELRPALEK